MIRLSPQQRIIAWRLALQPSVLRSELIIALWGHDADGGPLTIRTIDVRISQLRRLLPGIEINPHWGFGYSVPAEQRSVLLDFLAREIAANVHDQKMKQAA